jgi:hypothetical protein
MPNKINIFFETGAVCYSGNVKTFILTELGSALRVLTDRVLTGCYQDTVLKVTGTDQVRSCV